MKRLMILQGEIAEAVVTQPLGPVDTATHRGRWLGLGDALQAIKEEQDAADR